MFLVGLIIYGFYYSTGYYYVEGLGYAIIQDILNHVLFNSKFLILLCLAKLLTTILTLSSGGSGGVFSPSLFMGATLGMAFGIFANHLITQPLDNILFAVAGIAGLIAGTTGAIFTSIIFTIELTHDFNTTFVIILTASVASLTRSILLPGVNIYTAGLIQKHLNINLHRDSK